MKVRRIILCRVLLLIVFVKRSNLQQWMSLAVTGTSSLIKDRRGCEYLDILSNIQKRVCQDNVELMGAVTKGAIISLRECKHQFKWRRWNCSTVNIFKNPYHSPFGVALNEGTREAGFVHSIFSAGVTYAVTRECSKGRYTSCNCDHSLRGFSENGFKWSGCSDNIFFGIRFSKAFVDSTESERQKSVTFERVLMNLHNNNAGRLVIARNMVLRCKCHGPSGTCATKTCARMMPPFRKIGHLLKEKFDSALHVQMETIGTRKELLPVDKRLKPLTAPDLVYIAKSPSFCTADKKTGSLGTKGRMCHKNSINTDGCSLLCCDRGYVEHEVVLTERCKCKFHWCCQVTCKVCKPRKRVYTCL